MEKGLEIYRVEEGEVVFDINRDKETIWASIDQIAQLFNVSRRSIELHLNNIYGDGELEVGATAKESFAVRIEGKRTVKRKVRFYNLDAIISVGYRVNSKKATKFRVWATSVLKRYIVDGAAVNERRVKELPEKKLLQLEGTLSMIKRLMEKQELAEGEAKGILEVISRYGKTAETISEYNAGEIPVSFKKSGGLRRNLTIGEVRNLSENLREQQKEREEFGELRDETKFEEFLSGLSEDVTGKNVPEKAGRLLYYVVKGEPFLKGNREIGALLFIYFLTINDCSLSANGETKISDRALTAIVLLIAESEPIEKELMVSLVAKLLG